VHVDQCVEAAFGRTKEPVDRALFVALYMVGIKLFEEVVADLERLALFAERAFDEA
jgi:hypothetical protein